MSDCEYNQEYINRSMTDRSVAKMNAQIIEEYWHSRGRTDVYAKIKKETLYHKGQFYTVYKTISNLVNGMPPELEEKPKTKPKKLKKVKKVVRQTPRQAIKAEHRRLLNKFLKQVCKNHDLTPESLKGSGRGLEYVAARRDFSVRAYNAGITVKAIGDFLGKDHTTICHHLKMSRGGV